MSKFGPFWATVGRTPSGSASTGVPGPLALDATSGLGSDRLSMRPFSQEKLEEYYGGFYPTEAWTASLKPIPQYPANVAHALGEKAWSTPVWVETVG